MRNSASPQRRLEIATRIKKVIPPLVRMIVMKNLTSIFFLLLTVEASGQAFITTWKTDYAGISASNQITIPTTGTGYGYSIYWEDVDNAGINGTIPGPVTGNYTITFPSIGTYRVAITGAFPRIYFNGDVNSSVPNSDYIKILTVEQWGDQVWTSFANAFQRCKLTVKAIDSPNLTQVTDMSNMFGGVDSFSHPIGHWDVSKVTNMRGMFRFSMLNEPIGISEWDVSSVTDMSGMFEHAEQFNEPIGKWDVSNVTNMSEMFVAAILFDQPIGDWDVSNVISMRRMFGIDIDGWKSLVFNQPIGDWNVSKVTDMSGMFSAAAYFNQPIGEWDVSRVADMSLMFNGAVRFNQPIGDWDVSSVTNMNSMFAYYDFFGVSSFNQPIGSWVVSNVTDMRRMFHGADHFNQSLGTWDVSSVTDMTEMLSLTGLSRVNYDQTLIGWAQNNVKSNVILGAEGLQYCAAEKSRSYLITSMGWGITGDSKVDIPSPSLSVTQPFCFGSTGVIDVEIQNPNDHYSFDNGTTFQTPNSKSGLIPGNYFVVTKDSTDCISAAMPAIINPPFDKPELPVISGSPIVCPNIKQVDYSANISEYVYNWSINGGVLLSQDNSYIKVDWGQTNFNAMVKTVGLDHHNCPTDTATFNVKIQVKLKPDKPHGIDSVCYNFRSGVPYQTSYTNGSVYTWITDGGSVSDGETSSSAKVNWTDVGQFKLWVNEQNTTSTDFCEGTSDTLNITVFRDLASITMNFVSVDYEDDKKVQIQWDATLLERISDLIIVSRRIAGSGAPWEVVATLDKNVQSFLDQNVPTGQSAFEYKIEGFNKCDEGLQTVIHNTIKLAGEKDEPEEVIDLSWNDYNGWDGVERYEVWRKLDGAETYKLIDVTPGDITSYQGKHGSDGFVHVLRIKAKKANENTISWSNEIELTFDNPIDFIPNIITPDGDTKNEFFFIPKLDLYPENYLNIFNRWGKSVYERVNYKNDWNAYGLPNGIYYYTLFLPKRNSSFKGWVQVVK
jgi:gliding motility-associated-like protein